MIMKKFYELSSADFTQILTDKKEVEILIDYDTLHVEHLKLMPIDNTEVVINPTILDEDNYNLLLIDALQSNDMFMASLLGWQKANATVFCKKYNDDLYKLRLVF
ncbi:hypothetical protein FLTE109939_01200 [Flavobacterium terrigena]|uniref:Uncharacterized protein n=2 Tax=Flavobacterium terrigena TaxID=402734 RepID=A0A1H6QFK0_9FLAO|nr:hypothetical protein SAMN05660918_0216 [Flavobacterium terrigena]